jgi:prepilin-type N-terminal cleavage/methylation domain-containing protein
MESMRKNQKGDTIVEVLICIAIVGLILVASYALANRSSTATRAAQERSEALGYSEAQLEQLKRFVAGNDAWNSLCFDSSGNATANTDDCNFGTEGRYHVQIKMDAGENTTYTITTTWDRIGGGQQQTLDISYRTY